MPDEKGAGVNWEEGSAGSWNREQGTTLGTWNCEQGTGDRDWEKKLSADVRM